MNNQKPTIVLVTGAWHKPDLYSPLIESLQAYGYKVLAPHLPSIGGSMPTFDEDVSLIRTTIQSGISQDEEIGVLMHSYGGVVGSAAVQGLSKPQPSSNGGVTKLIYMAAFALEEGVSLNGVRNEDHPPWVEPVNDGKQLKAHDNINIFYNDVEESVAKSLPERLVLQARGPFQSEQTFAAWKHIDSTFIVCELDNAIPVQAQEMMINQPGGRFEVERLRAGHSPFISMPQETTDIIRRALGERV